MKKLLCVLMLGMVFGQAQLTTRIYDLPTIEFLPYTENDIALFLPEITGHNLENAVVSIYSVNDWTLYTDQSVALTAEASIRTWYLDHGGNWQDYTGAQAHFHGESSNGGGGGYYINASEEFNIHAVMSPSHTIRAFGVHVGGTVDVTISVTAVFPDDDTGDTDGDGYDDVCYEEGFGAGADSGGVNGDGELNILDMLVYINYIVNG